MDLRRRQQSHHMPAVSVLLTKTMDSDVIARRRANGDSTASSRTCSSRSDVFVCASGCLAIFIVASLAIGTAYAEDFQNTPPSLYFDRNWKISENEPVGTVIMRVQASDSPNDVLTFGLELNRGIGAIGSSEEDEDNHTPFRINPNTGVVYLNESLAGRGGEMINIYVTVSDGQLDSKVEVPVTILRADSQNYSNQYRPGLALPPTFQPSAKNVTRLLPPFRSLPGVASSTNIINSNGQRPHPYQMHTYPRPPNGYSQPTEINGSKNTNDAYNGNEKDDTNEDGTNNRTPNEGGNTNLGGGGQIYTYTRPTASGDGDKNDTFRTSSANEPTSTTSNGPRVIQLSLAMVLALCGVVIVAASLVAVYMCRQNLCAFGRTLKKRSKEEMAKKSNTSTIGSGLSLSGTEDSRNSMGMQNWSGPTAFSNRYVPWERDNQHMQATSQLSTSSSTANSQLKSDRWEFPRHRLKFFNVLGQGAFGLVWRCEATEINGNDGITVVAVKTLKENASDIEIKDLHSELQVMKTLEPHVNVVRLLGCCTEKEPIFVILEFVNRGKLQDYLRNSRAERHYGNAHGNSSILTSGDLTSFMYQVARGMEYLSMKGIIHRDLAARNILITDDHTCKVADFGFARDVITSKVYERKSEGKLPIRWMAIESLYDDIFSVKSDIWSFGILMWEIVTLGSTPYPGISAADVMRKVRDGYRLDKPEHCRRELYNIMYYCWTKDYEERPAFSEIVALLDKLMVTETDYIELERFPDHNYYNMHSLSGEKL